MKELWQDFKAFLLLQECSDNHKINYCMEENNKLNAGATPQIFKNAQALRKRMTPAEILLWEKIRDRKIMGFKFRRQHPFSRFILDFYCHEVKLCIELDGEIHDSEVQMARDKDRTNVLAEFDINVMRFRNIEVIENVDSVLEAIIKTALKLKTKDPLQRL